MAIQVLDACAMIATLWKESGSLVVDALLASPSDVCYAHASKSSPQTTANSTRSSRWASARSCSSADDPTPETSDNALQ